MLWVVLCFRNYRKQCALIKKKWFYQCCPNSFSLGHYILIHCPSYVPHIFSRTFCVYFLAIHSIKRKNKGQPKMFGMTAQKTRSLTVNRIMQWPTGLHGKGWLWMATGPYKCWSRTFHKSWSDHHLKKVPSHYITVTSFIFSKRKVPASFKEVKTFKVAY